MYPSMPITVSVVYCGVWFSTLPSRRSQSGLAALRISGNSDREPSNCSLSSIRSWYSTAAVRVNDTFAGNDFVYVGASWYSQVLLSREFHWALLRSTGFALATVPELLGRRNTARPTTAA